MKKSRLNLYLTLVLVGMLLGAVITKKYMDRITNTDQNTTKEKVVTRIIERKDGSKETVIVDERVSKSTKTVTKVSNWSIGVGTSLVNKTNVHTLQIHRRILGDLSVGAYARSDSEFGLLLQYQF